MNRAARRAAKLPPRIATKAIEIQGFSPEFFQAVREFYEGHPVYSMVQLREIDAKSPLVRVAEVKCQRCGASLPPPSDKPQPADAFRAVQLTHEWSLDRSAHCGGRIELRVEPYLELTLAG